MSDLPTPAPPDLCSEGGVWVVQGAGDLVLLGGVLHFCDQGSDGLVLLVGLTQRGLELTVGVDESLDLLDGVHNEHVHQVLASTIQPVVERLWRMIGMVLLALLFIF